MVVSSLNSGSKKKVPVFRQNLAILISTTKRKEAKKPEIIAI